MTNFSVMIVRRYRFRRKSNPVHCPADILKKIQILTLTDYMTDAFVYEAVSR